MADDVLTLDHYNPDAVDADFAEMAALGFNTVRILIDTCDPSSGCSGTGPTGKLVPGYLDGVTGEGDVLTYQPAALLVDVELIRVVTTKINDGLSPAWHEISVFSPFPPAGEYGVSQWVYGSLPVRLSISIVGGP